MFASPSVDINIFGGRRATWTIVVLFLHLSCLACLAASDRRRQGLALTVCSSGCDFARVTDALLALPANSSGNRITITKGVYTGESTVQTSASTQLKLQAGDVTVVGESTSPVVWTFTSSVDLSGGQFTFTLSQVSIQFVGPQAIFSQSIPMQVNINDKIEITQGVALSNGAQWSQFRSLQINLIRSWQATGVYLEDSLWSQSDSVHIYIEGFSFGVSILETSIWAQSGALDITTTDDSGIAVYCPNYYAPGWSSSGATTTNGESGVQDSCIPGPIVYYASRSRSLAHVPILLFNFTSPAIVLRPKLNRIVKGNSDAGLSLTSFTELSAPVNASLPPSVVRSAHVLNGTWQVITNPTINATLSYLYSGLLTSETQKALFSNTQLEFQFDLFSAPSSYAIPGPQSNNTVVDLLPSMTKFSLRIQSWPWAATTNKLEVRIRILPTITAITRSSSTKISNFILGNSDSNDRGTTQLRLIDSVELDGVEVDSGGVEYDIDMQRSELVLKFSYFNSSLYYDPDMGVLLADQGGSGNDNTGVIVAAVVVTVVAVLVVLAAIALGIFVAMRRRRGRQRTLTRTRERLEQMQPQADSA